MKIYLIRREDFFKSIFSYAFLITAGSLWITIAMTDEQRKAYPYPITLNS